MSAFEDKADIVADVPWPRPRRPDAEHRHCGVILIFSSGMPGVKSRAVMTPPCRRVTAFWFCSPLGFVFVAQRASQALANVQRPLEHLLRCLVAKKLRQFLGDLRSLAIELGFLHGCELYVR